MFHFRSRDSVGGIAAGYGLDDRRVGVRVPVGSRIFSSPRRPDRVWGPSSLLSTTAAVRGSSPGLVMWDFVVDKVALGQVFSEYFGFPCQSSFHQLLQKSSTSIIWGLYNRPKWPQYLGTRSHPTNNKKTLSNGMSRGKAAGA
jgi:hypothetical protein